MPASSAIDKDIALFWERLPWTSHEDALILLKGHLIIEELLRQYCAERVVHAEHLEKAGLTFTQIVHVARAVSDDQGPSWIWGAVRKLNSLRNDLAHRLVPVGIEERRDQFISFVLKEMIASPLVKTSAVDHPRKLIVALCFLHAELLIALRYNPLQPSGNCTSTWGPR